MELGTPTIELKGIGPKTVKYYEKLGLFKAEDFLYYFPRDYIGYEDPVKIHPEHTGEIIFFEGVVVKRPLLRRKGKLSIVSATLSNEGTEVRAVWFHMPYLTKSLKAGETYVFRGRIEQQGMAYHVEQPLIFTKSQYEKIVNTLQPVYPLTKGLSNHALQKCIKTIFAGLDLKKTEDPERIRTLESVHFPANTEELKKARNSLAYEEFFLFLLKLKLLKDQKEQLVNGFQIYPTAYTKRIIEKLPYELTGAQKKVWQQVEEDLQKDHSMNRLVQGDVGSGKTIIATLAAVMTAASGYQAAIMAPTEILATQHFESITRMLSTYDIPLQTVLLTGSMSASQRKDAREKIENGEAKLVIGTHALFQEKVVFHSLALVVTDEQHRFGVRQRELLAKKNEQPPHVLVMSATPIPRTLAIILYGDLDVSVIDELPARRLPVKNCVVNNDYRQTAYRFMEKEIKAGRQVYVICPLVEESEGLDCENVTDYTEKLRAVFAHDENIRIACLHGKMKPAQKNQVMEAFYKNDVQILVSTTVVEVGVNVPNATVMMVENAERFGLSQLHQLRGRIGRGDQQSYCIFMSSGASKDTMERLEVLKKSNDGFYIANEDLKLRGPGELFGQRQSGELHFAIADIFRDSALLKKAAEDVGKLMSEDPDLSLDKNKRLREKLLKSDFDHMTL
ncbi:MAG: ATP-dependent DNA helicase RecG [Lachnospiraceae bacterium]|nr:ATP-dependent DNA helicase RecG [Lachnospiraceae bacterium]